MFCKVVLPAGDMYRLAEFPKSLADLRANILHKYGKKLSGDFILSIEKKPNMPELLENESHFATVTSKLKSGETLKVFVKETHGAKPDANKIKHAKSLDEPAILNEFPGFEDLTKATSEIIFVPARNQSSSEAEASQGEFTPGQMKVIEKMIDNRLEQLENRLRSYMESQLQTLLQKKLQPEKKQASFVIRHRDRSEMGALTLETALPSSLAGTSTSDSAMQLPKIEIHQPANNTTSSGNISILGTSTSKIRRVSRVAQSGNEDSKSVVGQGNIRTPGPIVAGIYICDGCRMNPITGPHYKCRECVDFDYCQNCQKTKPHPHALYLITPEEEKTEVLNIQRSINARKSLIASKSNTNSIAPESQSEISGRESMRSTRRATLHSGDLGGDLVQRKEGLVKPYRAKLIREPDNPIPNISPAKPYEITFTLKNSGENEWPKNTEIYCLAGCHFGSSEKVKSLKPGEELDITLPLQAPNAVGQFSSSWKLRYPAGDAVKQFGPKLTFEIQVEDISKAGEMSRIENLGKYNYFSIKNLKFNSLESKFSEDAVRKARFLQEMFGGELRQHLDFVSNCKSSVSVDEIVDLYLQAETTTGGK